MTDGQQLKQWNAHDFGHWPLEQVFGAPADGLDDKGRVDRSYDGRRSR
jgi:hypothetical protein